ncbi:MAG: peptidoglycan-binding protein [Mesorhizobium sp.]|uniref:peptidoglycan-binding domain-containing protein n=1 Tax=Mesorhizobium sp. TaxID=1871066 RepID=UPI001AC152A1|nr:peptidoglycan-binding domain-containing protein [Mesorhizobium sp.]MBN9217670.1 peptidoglycan-binding protein [Mesorhizobium sp.]
MTRIFSMMLAMALLGLVPEIARAADKFESGQCMTLHNDRKDGPVKDMAVQLQDDIISISFTEWDVPNTEFQTSAKCYPQKGKLECQIDCDGGHVTVSAAPDGAWELDSSLLYSMTGSESLFAVQGVSDTAFLLGKFRVARDTQNKLCRMSPDRVFVGLAPGDISPRVERAEKLLSRLGLLLEFPDTVYDEATAEAVRRFQRQYGLAQSGIIDEPTSQALVSAGFVGTGC